MWRRCGKRFNFTSMLGMRSFAKRECRDSNGDCDSTNSLERKSRLLDVAIPRALVLRGKGRLGLTILICQRVVAPSLRLEVPQIVGSIQSLVAKPTD